MSWVRAAYPHGAAGSAERSWTSDEADMIVATVNKAPAARNARPWSLELGDRRAVLRELSEADVPESDPHERQISFGAALTNLVLAVRSTGWATEVHVGHGDQVVATVEASRPRSPTATERQRHRAVGRRDSYRRAFETQPLSHVTREALSQAACSPGVLARWVTGAGEITYLARSLVYTAHVHHEDPGYQWELAAWTAEHERSEGSPARASGTSGPTSRLVTATTRLPDEGRLAARIASESVMVLSTPLAGRSGYITVGQAMQHAWLEATSLGVAASVLIEPLRLPEVRSGLAERMVLGGLPLVLLRFGYPAVPIPSQERRPLGQISPQARRPGW